MKGIAMSERKIGVAWSARVAEAICARVASGELRIIGARADQGQDRAKGKTGAG